METGLKNLLLSGNAGRQTIIHFPNGEHADITDGFYSGSLKLEEILCASENIEFGECNASKFEAKISGLPDISNTMIYVYQRIAFDKSKSKILIDHKGNRIITHAGENILLGRHADYIIPLFYGRVDSAVLQTDRVHRVITAYDELYFNRDRNCADWYTNFFAGTGTHTLKQFRNSLFNFIGIDQEETTLINDDIILEENLSTTTLKFSDVIKAICQINACFGHIDRNGVYKYIYLKADNESFDLSDNYRSNNSTFESYTVKKIDKIQVNSEEGDIGAIVGTGDNPYIIQGNFLVWGKGAEDLNTIATNVLNAVKDIEYRPLSIQPIYSEPYITVGNILTLTTKRDGTNITSYILRNSLDFVQLFHQTLEAEGDEYRDEVVDDVNAEINQLKGKTLKITKNVEEFSVALTDLEKGYSEIKQEADKISLTVGNKVDKGDVSNQLSIEQSQITISGNRLVINTTNFNLTADGSMSCSSAYITGGSIQVDTGGDSNAFITLRYKGTGRSCTISPTYFRAGDDTSNIKVSYSDITCTDGDFGFSITPKNFKLSNILMADQWTFKYSRNTTSYFSFTSSGLYCNSPAEIVGDLNVKGALTISSEKTGDIIDISIFDNVSILTQRTITLKSTDGAKTSQIKINNEGKINIEGTDVIVGSSSSSIGFFGHGAHGKESVEYSRISIGTPTTTELKYVVRDIVDALSAYGLIEAI
jgi:hypothetical protein